MCFSKLIPSKYKNSTIENSTLTPEKLFNDYYGPLMLKYLEIPNLYHVIAVGSHASAILQWDMIHPIEYLTCTCECTKVKKMHVHMLVQCMANRGQRQRFFAKLNKELGLKTVERSTRFQKFIELKNFGHVTRAFMYIAREQSYWDKHVLGMQCKHAHFTPYGLNAFSINGCVGKTELWNEIVHPFLSRNGYQAQVIAAVKEYEEFRQQKQKNFNQKIATTVLQHKIARPTRARVSRPFSATTSETEETIGSVTIPIRGRLTAKLRDWAELIRANPEMALRLIDETSKGRIISFLRDNPSEIMGGLQVLIDEQRPKKENTVPDWIKQLREVASSQDSDFDDMDNGHD